MGEESTGEFISVVNGRYVWTQDVEDSTVQFTSVAAAKEYWAATSGTTFYTDEPVDICQIQLCLFAEFD